MKVPLKIVGNWQKPRIKVGDDFIKNVVGKAAQDQLKKGQDTERVQMKDFSPTYRALEMYEVKRIAVEDASLAKRGLTAEDLVVPVDVLSSGEIADLIEAHDVVLSF